MKRKIFLILYYGFARFLPPSHSKFLLGKWGGVLRNFCARHIFKSCPKDVNVEHMAFFGNGKDIELGYKSSIGIHCHVPNNIIIGERVMMGPYCYFLGSSTHAHARSDISMMEQGFTHSNIPTVIGDDVWMGRECLIIGGKKIGSHTIIAARSVVCKNVPDYVMAAGNPIQVKKSRIPSMD